MAGRKVTTEEARQHEVEAWALRCKGWTMARIATAIGVSPSGVCQMLQRASKRVVEKLDEKVEQVKIEQEATLAYIADEALQAWERSKPKRREKAKQPGLGCGDVAYLEQARAALADIRKIWGADAPVKSELGGPGGMPLAIAFIEVPRDGDQHITPAVLHDPAADPARSAS